MLLAGIFVVVKELNETDAAENFFGLWCFMAEILNENQNFTSTLTFEMNKRLYVFLKPSLKL